MATISAPKLVSLALELLLFLAMLLLPFLGHKLLKALLMLFLPEDKVSQVLHFLLRYPFVLFWTLSIGLAGTTYFMDTQSSPDIIILNLFFESLLCLSLVYQMIRHYKNAHGLLVNFAKLPPSLIIAYMLLLVLGNDISREGAWFLLFGMIPFGLALTAALLVIALVLYVVHDLRLQK